jgi:hypothetical protein
MLEATPVSGRRAVKTLIIMLAVVITQLEVCAAFTIDFRDYPDGTTVFAVDSGPAQLTAAGTASYLGFGPDGVFGYFSLSEVSEVFNGALAVVAPFPIDGAYDYSSRLNMVFNVPVLSLSFDAYCYRNAGYDYTGTDAAGLAFSGGGGIPGIIDGGAPGFPNPFQTYTISVPPGASIESLTIFNHDPVALDGAFWVQSITFQPVPEPSTITMLTVGGILSGLLFIRRRKRMVVSAFFR